MKTLLLKDGYMLRKYCRSYLLLVAVFSAAALVSRDNGFFLVYPCLLGGILPVTMMSYDERTRWDRYCASLPVTKEQIVTEKYLLGLILIACGAVLCTVLCVARQAISGAVSPRETALQVLTVLATSFLAPSVTLPLIFKFGVEKGRLTSLVMIGVICGCAVFVPSFLRERAMALPGWTPLVFCLVGLAIYAVSWRFAVSFYARREL